MHFFKKIAHKSDQKPQTSVTLDFSAKSVHASTNF